jgi:RNA-binding protein YhbY
LRDLSGGEIIIDGSKDFCTQEEYDVWRRIRNTYYFMSRAAEVPLIGEYIYRLMYQAQKIPSYYPRRDLSEPTMGVRYLSTLVKFRGLCQTLHSTVSVNKFPVVHTFYATAMALDTLAGNKDNYLVICDSDLNRIWVAEHPEKSRIKYFAPCFRVKKRLLLYGVPESNIFLTGFPLPKENIGSFERMEILKDDLANRLGRLDPQSIFVRTHAGAVAQYLERPIQRSSKEGYFVLTFAVGGAGVQVGMAEKIIRSLKHRIEEGAIKVNLAAGVNPDVNAVFEKCIDSLGLARYQGNGIRIIYGKDTDTYFQQFNSALRETDVLWTKPSELSFYCALGIPILFAPSVGAHEDLNMQWLQEIHAGVQPGPLEHTDQWLFDMRADGILAEAAWDGFLKARKLGAYKIEQLISQGNFAPGDSPLTR